MSDVAYSMGRIIIVVGSASTALLQRLHQVEAEISGDDVSLITVSNEEDMLTLELLEAITFDELDELLDCDGALAPREHLNPREILDIDAETLLRDCGPALEMVPQYQLWNMHPLRPGKGQQKTTSGKRVYTKTPRMRV
jgi:hypothetical protein